MQPTRWVMLGGARLIWRLGRPRNQLRNGYTESVSFTWAPAKAEAHLKKHGIDFREAATVFDDSGSVAFPDTDHSWGE